MCFRNNICFYCCKAILWLAINRGFCFNFY
nr:MAG TPA: hypothetical protein [Caudoviricetes sp.]